MSEGLGITALCDRSLPWCELLEPCSAERINHGKIFGACIAEEAPTVLLPACPHCLEQEFAAVSKTSKRREDAHVAYSARSRTPFRCDGGQHSAVMADTVPR